MYFQIFVSAKQKGETLNIRNWRKLNSNAMLVSNTEFWSKWRNVGKCFRNFIIFKFV